MNQRVARNSSLIVLLVLAVLLSGCSISGSIRVDVKRYLVSGVVTLAGTGAPLANAEVFFNGRMNALAKTNSSGYYETYLAKGTYTVTIRGPHGDTKDHVTVTGREVLHFSVTPGWYNWELLYALSGIKRYDVDGHGRLVSSNDQLTRWDRPKVRVYFDTFDEPWNAPTGWATAYFDDVRYWETRLNGRVSFERVSSSYQADVVVRLVPGGSLGNAIAEHGWERHNGVLNRVIIRIDAGYATQRDLWEHEWAHAMGVYHSYDRYSVMYPEVLSGQRKSLSSTELDHIRLMYDLPPGLTVNQTWGMLSTEDGDGEGDTSELIQQETGWTYSGHIRTADGETIQLSEYEAQDLLFDW